MFSLYSDKGRIKVERTEETELDFDIRTSVGNSRIIGAGLVLNADVVQMRTSASMRNENVIGTIFSQFLYLLADLNQGLALEQLLHWVEGAFVAVGMTSRGNRGILVIHNLPLEFDGVDVVPTGGAPRSAVYVLGTLSNGQQNSTIDSLQYIECQHTSAPCSHALFVTSSMTKKWYRKLTRAGDHIVPYGRLRHEIAEGFTRKTDRLLLVQSAVDYAQTLYDVGRVVFDIMPAQFSVELVAGLTRTVWLASDYKLSMEVPCYEAAIGRRITQAH